jgi:hypothetical protein
VAYDVLNVLHRAKRRLVASDIADRMNPGMVLGGVTIAGNLRKAICSRRPIRRARG